MIPIDPGGIIIAFLLAYISIALLLGLLIGFFVSQKVKLLLRRRPISSAMVIILLVIQSTPPFVSAYQNFVLKRDREKLEHYTVHYKTLQQAERINQITFPKGTAFNNWFIDYSNGKQIEFGTAQMPTPILYRGLLVSKIERVLYLGWSDKLTLSEDQRIDGWRCSRDWPVNIDFKEPAGYRPQVIS